MGIATLQEAYNLGVEAAHNQERLTKSVAARYIGYRHASQMAPCKPTGHERWLQFERGYKSVCEEPRRKSDYTKSDFLAAAHALGEMGERFTWAAVCDLVGCGLSTLHRANNWKAAIRKAYKAGTCSQVQGDNPAALEPCGQCIARVPAEKLRRFERTPLLCPDCAEAYLAAVRRDQGVLAA
jgi:hypothetical protein